MALFAGAAYMRCASVFFASNSLWGGEGALAPRPKENSKQKRQTRTAPHCDRGNLRMVNQVATGAGKAFAYGTGAGGRSHLAKLRDGVRHCNSALSLSFLLRILSGARRLRRPALERIRSKNERLSAQSFTRRYEMVRDAVTDRAPRAFKEQALGSRRAERASEPRKGRPQRASEPNTKPGGVRVVCALCFFLFTKRIFKKI